MSVSSPFFKYSFKRHEQKLKTWIENLTGNANKKTTKQIETLKQNKNAEKCWDTKKKQQKKK